MGRIKLLLLILGGVVSSYSLVVLGYFPFLGFAVFALIVLSLLYFFRQKKDKFFTGAYILGIILSIFMVLRANQLLIFLNVMTVFYIGWVLVMYRGREEKFSFLKILFSPITDLLKIMKTKEGGLGEIGEIGKIREIGKKEETQVSIVITIVVLLIIVPLLATVNPIFADLVDLSNLGKFFTQENVFIWLTRIVFFLLFVVLGGRVLTLINKKGDQGDKGDREDLGDKGELGDIGSVKQTSEINLAFPKIATGIVLAIFFVTQIQFYLMGGENLAAIGKTNSMQTREVFFQLCLVVLVISTLIYNGKNLKGRERKVSYFLFGEMLFLILIAFKSDFDYISRYGFTLKRLWGLTGIVGVLGGLGVLGKEYLSKFRKEIIVRNVCFLWAGLLILVNIINFDYLIAKVNRSISFMGTDYLYLAGLSSDSASYKQLLDEVSLKAEKIKDQKYKFGFYYHMNANISYLLNKYSKIDIRTFNWSEYQEYLRIKNIDWAKYKNLL